MTSNVRQNHPGYYGVLVAIALTWYCGLGAVFLAQAAELHKLSSYRLIFHYIPGDAWGGWYVALGLLLFVASTVSRVPHRYVQILLAFGWFTTLFFLSTFIIYDIFNGVPTATLMPAFGTMALVEYRALREPPINPAMLGRRAAKDKSKR